MNTKGRRGEGEGTAEQAATPEISPDGRLVVRSSSHPPHSERPQPLVDASGVHDRPANLIADPSSRVRRDTPRVRPGTRSSRPPGPPPGGARPVPVLSAEVALAIAAATAQPEGALRDEVTRRTRRPSPPEAASGSRVSVLLKALVVLFALSLLVALWPSD